MLGITITIFLQLLQNLVDFNWHNLDLFPFDPYIPLFEIFLKAIINEFRLFSSQKLHINLLLISIVILLVSKLEQLMESIQFKQESIIILMEYSHRLLWIIVTKHYFLDIVIYIIIFLINPANLISFNLRFFPKNFLPF
jgi:hypothetical protein